MSRFYGSLCICGMLYRLMLKNTEQGIRILHVLSIKWF